MTIKKQNPGRHLRTPKTRLPQTRLMPKIGSASLTFGLLVSLLFINAPAQALSGPTPAAPYAAKMYGVTLPAETNTAENEIAVAEPLPALAAENEAVTTDSAAPVAGVNAAASAQVEFELAATWTAPTPNPVPAGQAVLGTFTVAANHVAGLAGSTDFTVIVDGVNAGFATFARGTVSNGGRTLTVPFTDFEFATSERFGFSLIGDQQGDMGATVRVLNGGIEIIRESLPPLPVQRGTQAWDVVLSQHGATNSIQSQIVGLRLNLALDRTSPIPMGDIEFELFFQDINAESARVPAATRFQPTRTNGSVLPFDELTVFSTAPGDSFIIGGGQQVRGYLTQGNNSWRVRIPADQINPFVTLTSSNPTHGQALDPSMRVFATLEIQGRSGLIATQFQNSISFAGNVNQAFWGGIPETNRGITTMVGGEPTVNNRVAFTMTPAGSFSGVWVQNHNSLRMMWGETHHTPWGPTPSLQTGPAVHTAPWSAADFIPAGSEVMSRAGTDGNGFVAGCIAIDPNATPFQGRTQIFNHNHTMAPATQMRLFATRAAINLQTQNCAQIPSADWFEITPRSQMNGYSNLFFELSNPESITAIRAIGHTTLIIEAIHVTRMASPTEAGWLTARGWWPRSNDINDVFNLRGDSSHVTAATPGQLFPSTNGSRDVIFGNYGFPRVTLSASTTAPSLGQAVTFTTRAANVSNFGNMDLVVRHQMDARLHFIPGSVRVNGQPAPNPTISAPMAGTWALGTQVVELVFNLGSQPVNQIFEITYDAEARWDVGSVHNTAWMVPTAAAQANGFTGINTANGTMAQVTLQRQLTGNISLTKEVARPLMAPGLGPLTRTLPPIETPNAWRLTTVNGTNDALHTAIVDILPWYGDGRGTTNNVEHQVAGFASSHPTTIFYTFTDPGLIDPDPWAPQNSAGQRGTPGNLWQQWGTFNAGQYQTWPHHQQPTALLIQPTAIPVGATVTHEITFTAVTPAGQTGTFVNYAWQRDGVNRLHLVRAEGTTSHYPSIALTKTIGGQTALGVAANTPQTVDFTITNTGTEPLSNLLFTDITLTGPAVTDIRFNEGWLLNAAGMIVNPAGDLLTLAPGASVTASGTLPGMGLFSEHENLAHVTATGTLTGTVVSDEATLYAIVNLPNNAGIALPETGGNGDNPWLVTAAASIATIGITVLLSKRAHQIFKATA